MSDNLQFPVPDAFAKAAWIDNDKYLAMYKRSVEDPEGFWGEQGKQIDWIKPYTKVKDTSFDGQVKIQWFYDGTLNASANCIDRHLATRGDQIAILWEPDDPNEDAKTLTYKELHEAVCRLANALKEKKIKKGDIVTILYADGARGGDRHARLRAYWRDAFRCVRRLFAGRPGRPHP